MKSVVIILCITFAAANSMSVEKGNKGGHRMRGGGVEINPNLGAPLPPIPSKDTSGVDG